MNFKLTIVIPTLNSQKYLKKTLSILKQQVFQNFIIYVADGGSRDDTLELFKKSKLKYKILSKKDKSTEEAVNKCFKKIKTDYYTILGSDDFYDDKFYLQNLINSIEKKNIDFVMPGLAIIYGNKKIYKSNNSNYNFNVIRYRPIFPGFGWIAKKKISKILFNERYKVASDYDFLLKVYQKKYKFYREKKSIYCFRAGGFSTRNYLKGLKEVKEIAIKFKGPKILIYTTYYFQIIKYALKYHFKYYLNLINIKSS